ncbi:PhoPQ-activated pathogenicity-related family protein [Algoriphagus aestuariicola]|uniref:PhoPQ-activated pathogenicity-related family protein n=1 Tax=Algoriphagus aestuariicola TaxID=1852016 RepID=A0ABS3BJR0_9BACT|nr:PhoPQ-activated pathogenicity-related family protein [Algoriphagus aestuariicola]MBN7799539.1 PhoPQ-activated pathogenicity-related family protein [Algoriphagus aestuariicola]
MNQERYWLALSWVAVVFGTSLIFSCQKPAEKAAEAELSSSTLLKDYVHAADSTYRYEIVHSVPGEEFDYVVLKMYSQHWLTPDIVDKTEWWHWVSAVVPKNTPHQTGMLWISGGSTNSKMPEEPDPLILAAATQTNSIVAKIHNVPFQPITFANDTFGERYEDEIISYGWRKFLEGGAKDKDAIWLARLPMTKAAKLAMDAVSDMAKTKYSKILDSYVVGGASKRGWTTWTTAAVDDRVVGIVPVVIDLLNLVPSFEHHWQNYGFWAPAVGDYVREEVMEWVGTPEFDRMMEITEPYSFRKDYEMPKLLINAAGDEFFQPDSWNFYWDSLPGEKHLMYVPNFGHDIGDSDALPNMIAFYGSILNKTTRPNYEWKIEGDKILVKTDPSNRPASVKLWSALNPLSRDFRIDVFGPNWVAEEIRLPESGELEVLLKTPDEGFRGYFVELTYAGESPLKVTTGVEVLPRTYPFEPFVSKKASTPAVH